MNYHEIEPSRSRVFVALATSALLFLAGSGIAARTGLRATALTAVDECAGDSASHVYVTTNDRRRLASEGHSCSLVVYEGQEATFSLFESVCSSGSSSDIEWSIGGETTKGSCSATFTCTQTGNVEAKVFQVVWHIMSVYCEVPES